MLKLIITVVCMVMLWTSVGFCDPQWELISDTLWVDMNSIKVIQVDYDDVFKVNTKSTAKDNTITTSTLLMNKDTKMYCYTVMEFHDKNGNVESRLVTDSKVKRNWLINNDSVNEILKRVQ